MPRAIQQKFFRKNLALITAAIFIVIVIGSSLTFQRMFFSLIDYFQKNARQNLALSMLLFFALAAASAMLSPFSSVPLVPIAVLAWGSTATFLFLLSGWLAGGSVTYYIGYWAGHPLAKRFVPFEKVDKYLHRLSPKSQFSLVLLFRLASPAEIPGYVLGILRYSFSKYFLATFLAELPFALVAVYAGQVLVERKFFLFSAVLVFVAIFFYCVIRLFQKKLK